MEIIIGLYNWSHVKYNVNMRKTERERERELLGSIIDATLIGIVVWERLKMKGSKRE